MAGRRRWRTRPGPGGRAALVLLAVGLMAGPTLAGPISYIYDELGRLAAAVDPAGQTAVYAYDAVGNITAITNRASSQVAVLTFSPGCGGVGATVLVDGTGFSATPASNTVKFNGTTATVTAASFTELTATVPAGATTGTISVTAPGGSAASTRSFTVGCGAPTITSFTPSIALTAASVTVTGTSFDATAANDQILFNIANGAVNTASATSLGVTVPPTASCGHLTVTTPNGTAVSTADFFVPPPGRTVADVDTTGRVTLGTGQAISTSNNLKVHLRVFDETTGHRAFVKYARTAATCSQVALLQPNGVSVASGGTGNANCDPVGFVDPQFLSFTSSYTVAVTATNNNSNSPTTG